MSKDVAMNAVIDHLLTTMKDAEAKKNHYKNIEVDIKREGTEIVLPSHPTPMTYDEAIKSLEMKKKEEETVVSVMEEVDAFPTDGAFAFMKAMKKTYGWATPVPTKTFFGDRPPTTIAIETDFGEHAQIIWGEFAIPGIEGTLSTSWTEKKGKPIFVIGGKVKKRYQAAIADLAELTRQIVKEESIYRGKAISLNTDEDGDIEFSNPPTFLDLSRVNPNELTFSEDVAVQVETNLFTPIEYTAACRMTHIPLKRGVLLEGPFGTGKTLTAFVTAQKCRANGWTFIMIDRVKGLKQALEFARMYQPAVVFAEDIDRTVAGEDRTVEIDDILNTIDGVQSKGSEVITILTSNDVKKVNRAMLRPGRLDAIISVQAPDAVAVQKLLRLYARGLVSDDTDLTLAGEELAGQIPATIRECVERSKLYAISRAKKGFIKLTCEDIVKAARGMKYHLNLLNGVKDTVDKSLNERLGETFTQVIQAGIKGNGIYKKIKNVNEKVDEIHSRME